MPRALKPGHDFELSCASDIVGKTYNKIIQEHDDDFKAFFILRTSQ